MESEKATEQYLRKRVEVLGGEAYKFVSPQRRFTLDRMCVLQRGKTWFVEVKSENEVPSQGQYREIIRLIDKGHKACWVKTKAEVDTVIKLMEEDFYDTNYQGRSAVTKYLRQQREEAIAATK